MSGLLIAGIAQALAGGLLLYWWPTRTSLASGPPWGWAACCVAYLGVQMALVVVGVLALARP